MSMIKLTSVLSVSSEDKVYKADNLLSNDNFRKWKCASAGEKNAIIIFQLQSAERICSIDIGNEGSAFVEVLVGKAVDSDKYEVLLPAASFMSPAESRSSTNLNRVRMFTSTDFNKSVLSDRWDRVKFVCSQPFNQEIQYGLAFVRLFSPTKKVSNNENKVIDLGLINAEDENKEQNRELLVGSSFKRKIEANQTNTPSKILPLSPQFETSNSPLKNVLSSKSPQHTKNIADFIKEKRSTEQSTDNSHKSSSTSPEGKTLSSIPKTSEVENVEVKQHSSNAKKPLKGVIFTLSGFQNPLRSKIRDLAVKLGAAYRSDWSKDCTHLVCAFKNTPKSQAVKNTGGKIVKKEWIFDCQKAGKRLPVSNYLWYSEKKSSNHSNENSGSEYEVSAEGSSTENIDSEDIDTDEEIKRHLRKKTSKALSAPSKPRKTFSLPNYFDRELFFVYSDMSPEDTSACNRLLIAYGGKISDFMTKDVTIVITDKPWNPEFDEASKTNPSISFVHPSWVQACHDEEKRVDITKFLVKK